MTERSDTVVQGIDHYREGEILISAEVDLADNATVSIIVSGGLIETAVSGIDGG